MMHLQRTKLSILLASLLATEVFFRICNAFSNEGTHDEIGTVGNIRSRRQLETVGTSQDRRELQVYFTVPFDIGATQFSDFYDNDDTHSGNCGEGPVDSSRFDDQVCIARGGQCAVAWTQAGEWLEYGLSMLDAGNVDVKIRFASLSDAKRMAVDLDGKQLVVWNAPGLGYSTFLDRKIENVSLGAGVHTLKLRFLNSGINVCSISMMASSAPAPTPVNKPVTAAVAAPTPSDTLQVVGNNGLPSSVFPLGRCQGDCDENVDCAGELVCFQRDAGQAVPGCKGTAVESNDYCIRAEDLPPPTIPNSKTFRLKMYHEPGYWWQCDGVCDQSDITQDKDPKWCIQCDGSGCDDDELIKIRTCSSANTKFEFVATSKLNEVKIRVVGTNLCLMYEGYASTLRNTRLDTCGGSGEIWSTHGKGSFAGRRFELHPQGDASYCLTQQHHPKSGEDLRLEKCSVARGDDTNWWMTY